MFEKQMGLLIITLLLGVCNMKPLITGIPQGPFTISSSDYYVSVFPDSNTVNFYEGGSSN